jgi:hypothetical protein
LGPTLIGCATIVEGTKQTVTVTTTPAGAICEFKRGGMVIGIVNPTPGSIQLEKSKDNVAVTCTKEGHQGGGASLASEFQGMTFGNILFGGIIGVAVDASSGAMHEYKPSVHVTLIPEEFPTVESRDAFFATEIARIENEAAEAVKKVNDKCQPDQEDQCAKAVKAIGAEKDNQLAELERKRLLVRITG